MLGLQRVRASGVVQDKEANVGRIVLHLIIDLLSDKLGRAVEFLFVNPSDKFRHGNL